MEIEEKKALIKGIHKAWRIGDLNYKMHAGQLQIHEVLRSLPESRRIRMIECCRGYGKSVLNVLMACEDCAVKHPLNYPVRIIGPEKDQTTKIVSQIFDILINEAPAGWIERKGSVWIVGNNRIEVDGFNRGSIERLRGKRAKAIYLEEIRDVPSESLEYGLKSILLPMSLRSKSPITAATTSSRQILHSMNTYFRKVAQENEGYFNFSIYDCPLYSEDDIIQAIRDCGGEDTEDFKTEYLVQTIETQVRKAIPAFNESKHVTEFGFPETHFKRWLITDVGGLIDPTHSVVMFYDERVSKIRVIKEQIFSSQTPTSEIVAALRLLEDFAGIDDESEDKPSFMDAPGQFFVDLREEHIYQTRPVSKGSFGESVKSLNQGFFDNQIEIHTECKELIHQLKTGRLNKQHSDFERDPKIANFNAHHCDGVAALMYGWRMREMVKIKQRLNYHSDKQWINPRLLERMKAEESGLDLLKPRMRRF